MELFEGFCLICHKFKKVNLVNSFTLGGEKITCCENCENEIFEFVKKQTHNYITAKEELFKKLRKGGEK